MSPCVHLDLDGAWGDRVDVRGMAFLEKRHWGPRLRYCAPAREVEAFYFDVHDYLAPFILYGSGDFHYLAGVMLRRVHTPVTLVSFDNHPDWDIRPPRWACGGWINRALELPDVREATVWGCGNFEMANPAYLFANHAALRSGRLRVFPWAERQGERVRRRFDCMSRGNWRERFAAFASEIAGRDVYVTVDLDCLCQGEAATNWENGLFEAADVAWALRALREKSQIVAGDLCGAYSPPVYARWRQRFAGNWDHPKRPPPDPTIARQINQQALAVIWPELTSA